MKNKLIKILSLAITLAFIVFLPLKIVEAGSFRTCNGTPVIWEGDPTTLISTISFPSGTIQRQDLDGVISKWNNLQGMTLEFSPLSTFGGNYGLGNGKNEIALQNISSLGLTTSHFDACFWWFESQHIKEFDIEINPNNMQFGAPPEDNNSGNNSFRYTAVHELGHALGLLDNNESGAPSVLKQSLKGQCWCGSSTSERVQPLSDDTHSSRFLYPSSLTQRDLVACAFEVNQSSKNVVTTMANTTISVRQGRNFNIRGSFGSFGNTSENCDILFVLSTNNIISTSDRVIASGSGSAPPNSFGSFTWNATVPNNLAPGTYFLGLIIDPNNRVSEYREGNNVVVLSTRVQVLPSS